MWPHVKFSRRTGRNSSSRNCSWLLTYFEMWKLIKLLMVCTPWIDVTKSIPSGLEVRLLIIQILVELPFRNEDLGILSMVDVHLLEMRFSCSAFIR